MKLTAWPISVDEVEKYHFHGGDPDMFLADRLQHIDRNFGALLSEDNLAQELLDPFVFFQFISVIQGMLTPNGTPFHSNWRLLPCAVRMAHRLGATKLAAALEQSGRDLAAFDSKILDDFDSNRIRTDSAEGEALFDRLYEISIERFLDVRLRDCTYGTTPVTYPRSEKLNVALADWVSQEMPREVFPDKEAVQQRFKQHHDWACENVDGYEERFTTSYVSGVTYKMLKSLGLRFERNARRPKTPSELQVIPSGLVTSDGRQWIEFKFGDASILADAETLTEHTREFYPVRLTRGAHLRPYLMLVDSPLIEFDPEDYTTRLASNLRPHARRLKYRTLS